MKKFLLEDDKSGYNASQQYNRLVEQATSAINDLAFILSLSEKQLPEKYISQIFNDETLKPLIKNLFRLDRIETDTTKERLLDICKTIIETIGNIEFAIKIAPKTYMILLASEKNTMTAIRTLNIANPRIAEL